MWRVHHVNAITSGQTGLRQVAVMATLATGDEATGCSWDRLGHHVNGVAEVKLTMKNRWQPVQSQLVETDLGPRHICSCMLWVKTNRLSLLSLITK